MVMSKELIPESKRYNKGKFFDLTDALTNKDYSADMFAVPETGLSQVSSSNVIKDAAPLTKEEEDRKIQDLVAASAIDMDWQRDGQPSSRDLRKGLCGKMTDGLDSRQGGYQSKIPPPHYICHRCNVPGHFIKHCPTNGDPAYDKKQVKPPTGIPKSMLVATSDGSYVLPSGAFGVMEPDEAPFLEAVEGLLTRNDAPPVLPPDLSCPLCQKVMKYAALTSKCCCQSFCFDCIKDYILSKSACFCGVKDVLADDILPNNAARAAITRMLESNSSYSSTETDGTAFQFQPSSPQSNNAQFPALSAVSEGKKQPLSLSKKEISSSQGKPEEETLAIPSQPTPAKVKASGITDSSEVTYDSVSLKEPASQEGVQQAEGTQQEVTGEAVKKKKAKKARLVPSNDTQSCNSQGFPVWNASYDTYWHGMQTGYASPYASYLPYMVGYGLSSMYMPFTGVLPEVPFGTQAPMVSPVQCARQMSSRKDISSMKQENERDDRRRLQQPSSPVVEPSRRLKRKSTTSSSHHHSQRRRMEGSMRSTLLKS